MVRSPLIENRSVKDEVSKVACALGEISHVEQLAGDASTRSYYRIFYKHPETALAMVSQHPGSGEESLFLHIQNYLERLNAPVPGIFKHDPERGIVILEDLGDNLLESVISGLEFSETKHFYRIALDTLVLLQRRTSSSELRCSAFELAFDEAKLMWEMEFFVNHFVKGWANKKPGKSSLDVMNTFFRKICLEISAQPRFFTHRDYHSRNLILKDKQFFMIDFQDARMGPVQYDLASLLRDSYVSLPEEMVQDLLLSYIEQADFLSNRDQEHFLRIFDITSTQRNIKALGTFGYQISVRRADRYFSAIPGTGRNILRNILKYPEFKDFVSVIEDCVIEPALSISCIK